MKILRFIIVLVLFFSQTFLYSQAPEILWSRTYGLSGYESLYGAFQLPSGNFIAGGYQQDTATHYYAGWILKVDAEGNLIRENTTGMDDLHERFFTMTQGNDYTYLFTGDAQTTDNLVELYTQMADSTGSTIYGNRLGGTHNHIGRGAVVLSCGQCVFVGELQTTPHQGLLVWTFPNLSFMFQNAYPLGGGLDLYSINSTVDSALIVAGRIQPEAGSSWFAFLMKLDLGANCIGNQIYGFGGDDQRAYWAEQTPDSGYILCGYTTNNNNLNDRDLYIVKTDKTLTAEWTKRYSRAEGRMILNHPAGGYVLTGANYSTGPGVLIMRLDENGDSLWTVKAAGMVGNSIRFTSDGGYIISASSVNVTETKTDGILIRLGPEVKKKWTPQTSGTDKNLLGVSFNDALHGAAVGTEGTILQTNDGGKSWFLRPSGTGYALQGICFADVNRGITVGENGFLLVTTDGGTTWSSRNSGTTRSLSKVTFTDVDHATAVGEYGTIISTTDGGESWFPRTSGTTTYFYDVCFSDINMGTAVGENGSIFRTTDGGVSWFPQNSGTTKLLQGVCFTDSIHGVAVGQDGTILQTTNGGTVWFSQLSGITKNLMGVSFGDTMNGAAVGEDGIILRTTDGGENWSMESGGLSFQLSGVSFTDAVNGTVVGSSGCILRSTESTTSVKEEKLIEVPSEHRLFQNFPNPFNSFTKINYSIHSGERVTLRIYNALGQEIETLVNENKPAGNYELNWNPVDLTSGIYYYQLKAGLFIETRKMVLMK